MALGPLALGPLAWSSVRFLFCHHEQLFCRIGTPRDFHVTRYAAHFLNLRFFVGPSAWPLGLVRRFETSSPRLQRPRLVRDGDPRLCSGLPSRGLEYCGKHNVFG